MKKHIFAILHYFAVLLRLASTTRRKSSVANGLTTVELSKTPIIDGHFHIIPGGDCSASISDYVLDQCLSSVGIDIHANCSVTKFATLLKHRLSERKSTDENRKIAKIKQCRDAVIRQMNVTDKGKAHLDRLSEFYNIDRSVFIDSDAMQRFVHKNMGLSFYIANNYECINDLHISMSKIYKTTDRFTGLLSFADSKGVDFDLLLIVFNNFYKKFITIIELANKFQYLKHDDVTLKHRCEDIIAKFEETQQRFNQARISRDYSALDKDSITNLTYAYFLLQMILHKHNPHPITVIMSSPMQKIFSADHFNLDFKVPLFKSKFAAPKRMCIFRMQYRNRNDDILAEYFRYHRQIILFCTRNNETVDLTYYLAKNIVVNYQS